MVKLPTSSCSVLQEHRARPSLKFHLILKWKRDSRPDYSNFLLILWRDLYAESARAANAPPVTAGPPGADYFHSSCRCDIDLVVRDGPSFERYPTCRICDAVRPCCGIGN